MKGGGSSSKTVFIEVLTKFRSNSNPDLAFARVMSVFPGARFFRALHLVSHLH